MTGTGLKVLHVIPALAARYGGPSAAVLSMVKELINLPGIQAEIATTDADGAGGRLRTLDVSSDAPVHLFPLTFSEQWKYSAQLGNWLRANTGEYDVVHIHALWSYATAASAHAAHGAGVPYIVRPAGMLSEYTWQRKSVKKQLYWQLIERRTIGGAAAFHATSEDEANEIRAVRNDARVFVAANGVENNAFDDWPRDGALHDQVHRAGTDTAVVLFMSRLHPKKGIADRLLPAFAAMKTSAHLVIAGSEDPHAPGYERKIKAAVDHLGLRNRVTMLGNVVSDNRWPLLDQADVFVLPSHSENFGIVVGEAMARRCPIVVTDAVQSCSHVIAAGAGKVVPGDVSSLARGIDEVVANPRRKSIWGEAGRRYAEKHFRWASIAEQIRNMYEACIAAA